ncbi:hypothetical protein [Bosea sp. MMO-172]|uniref:hypothetical protein n=1 Tax=Bosea sp. MMO-172 TaxID=3127885 RepID=UPI003019AFBB
MTGATGRARSNSSQAQGKTVEGNVAQRCGRRSLLLPLLLISTTALTAPALSASVNWSGGTSADWFVAGNWSGSAVPTASDTVTIDNSSNNPVIGAAGAVASIVSLGSTATTSTLTIQNGGTLSTVSGYDAVGDAAGSTGTVSVAGTGSTWANSYGILLGTYGTGAVNVSGGGAVTSGDLHLGRMASGEGTATIDGVASSWTATGPVNVGYSGIVT